MRGKHAVRVLMTALVLVTSLGVPAWADPIEPRKSVYADPVASAPGDTVFVLIKDATVLVQRADTQNRRDSRASLLGISDLLRSFFMPSSLDNSSQNGKQSNDNREQRFESSLTALVKSVTPSGSLVIEARRVVVLNGQRQELTMTGQVRPMDIGPDNSVPSQRIANLVVDYKGPLRGHDRKGLIQSVLDILY